MLPPAATGGGPGCADSPGRVAQRARQFASHARPVRRPREPRRATIYCLPRSASAPPSRASTRNVSVRMQGPLPRELPLIFPQWTNQAQDA
eukprot:1192510-Prorocentrum_minimum.AAC.1